MLESGAVIVRQNYYIGVFEECAVFWSPMFGAASIASGANVPSRQQIGLGLAFDDYNWMIVGRRLDHARQVVRHIANEPIAVLVLYPLEPLAGMSWIGPLLNKGFLILAVLHNEGAIGVLIVNAVDTEQNDAVLVVIKILGHDNRSRFGTVVLAVGFAVGRRSR